MCGIASSAQEAIRRFETDSPQLVLMDIHLPEESIDGIDVAEQFRQCSDIPIIFMTAHTDHDTITRAKQAIPFGYLLKPLRRHEID